MGLNMGGMGVVFLVFFCDKIFMDKIENQIIILMVKGLKLEKIEYKGFIFFGLINVKGELFVIEYNCCMGDFEIEVVMLCLKLDLFDLLDGVVMNMFLECDIQFDECSVCIVMMVLGGYFEEY